jgi:hypothetical protein
MIVAIEFLVNGGVFYSEIGAKIDDPSAGGQKRLGKFGSESMWQGEKNKTGLARDLFWVGIGKLQRGRSLLVGKARKNLRERFADQLPRRRRDQVNLWMREEQTHQFLAGVTGSAHYRDLGSCHNAQCVFRLARIATKSCAKKQDRIKRIKLDWIPRNKNRVNLVNPV